MPALQSRLFSAQAVPTVSDFALSQLLIGVVFVFDLASFQFRKREHVLLCLISASVLIGVHFWLLDAHSAAILVWIAALRFFSSLFSRSRLLLGFFISLVIICGYWTWDGPLTALSVLASLMSTTSAFLAGDRAFRKMMMLASGLWIVHNALAGSPAAVLLEIFFLGGNVVGYLRHFGVQDLLHRPWRARDDGPDLRR